MIGHTYLGGKLDDAEKGGSRVGTVFNSSRRTTRAVV